MKHPYLNEDEFIRADLAERVMTAMNFMAHVEEGGLYGEVTVYEAMMEQDRLFAEYCSELGITDQTVKSELWRELQNER